MRLKFKRLLAAICTMIISSSLLVHIINQRIDSCEKCNKNKEAKITLTGEQQEVLVNEVSQTTLPPEINKTLSVVDQRGSPDLHSKKKFIYLIQVRRCLPQRLLQEDHLGNSQNCQCDIIVFSYQQNCVTNTDDDHIEYLYGKDKFSWNEGRNVLFRRSQARNLPYLYYVFLDDDIEFSFHPSYALGLKSKYQSPLRAFEDFLLRHEPAVGVSNYEVHHNADFILKTIKEICTNKNKENNETRKKDNRITNNNSKNDDINGNINNGYTHSVTDDRPSYVPIVHFDASFNAFHHKAINYLLPYSTEYDEKCWWHSQRLVITKVELLFRGHAILFTPVLTTNPSHGDYPKNDENAQTIWSSMVNEVITQVPSQYQNMPWIQNFLNNPLSHTDRSQAFCMKLPSHYPITPFSHFETIKS